MDASPVRVAPWVISQLLKNFLHRRQLREASADALPTYGHVRMTYAETFHLVSLTFGFESVRFNAEFVQVLDLYDDEAQGV